MLPCETIAVSLVDLWNCRQRQSVDGRQDAHGRSPQCRQLRPPTKSADQDSMRPADKPASVFYLNHRSEYSFVEVHFLVSLWVDKHGPDAAMPTLSKDTRVGLEWRFPSLSDLSVTTTHVVLREVTFDVILREDDWYEPIMRLWDWAKRRHVDHDMVDHTNATAGDHPAPDSDEMRRLRLASVASDSGAESNYSRSSRASSVASSEHTLADNEADHDHVERETRSHYTFQACEPSSQDFGGEHELRSHRSPPRESRSCRVANARSARGI